MVKKSLTILGSGTSQGVPVIACDCEVCISTDLKDKRLRSSVLVEMDDLKLVVDTGPDFRQQMLRANVNRVDAILFTHEHKDHVAGLDDVRAFNFKHQMDMPLYAEKRVMDHVKMEFQYCFQDLKYPGIPQLLANEIDLEPFEIKGVKITPIRGLHYKLPVLGYKFNEDCVYITDMNFIAEEELEKLKNIPILIINGLRNTEHISHFSLPEAIQIAEKVNAQKVFITHISHLLGLHEVVSKKLPKHIQLAYDGLKIEL